MIIEFMIGCLVGWYAKLFWDKVMYWKEVFLKMSKEERDNFLKNKK